MSVATRDRTPLTEVEQDAALAEIRAIIEASPDPRAAARQALEAIQRDRAAHVLEAPLPVLLAEANARLLEVAIDDPRFFGSLVERPNGAAALLMPTGRSQSERDTIARMLLAQWAGLELAPLPQWLEMSELTTV